MNIGPVTFSLPSTYVRQLIIAHRYRSRELRILLTGLLIGTLALWTIAFGLKWQFGIISAAVMMTCLFLSVPFGIRYTSDKAARTMRGVATPQTWLFTDGEISVTNTDSTQIRSPWSTIKTAVIRGDYLLLIPHAGGCSPIPIEVIRRDGCQEIIDHIRTIQTAQKT